MIRSASINWCPIDISFTTYIITKLFFLCHKRASCQYYIPPATSTWGSLLKFVKNFVGRPHLEPWLVNLINGYDSISLIHSRTLRHPGPSISWTINQMTAKTWVLPENCILPICSAHIWNSHRCKTSDNRPPATSSAVTQYLTVMTPNSHRLCSAYRS